MREGVVSRAYAAAIREVAAPRRFRRRTRERRTRGRLARAEILRFRRDMRCALRLPIETVYFLFTRFEMEQRKRDLEWLHIRVYVLYI